jgi:hypothetical protein
MDIALMTGFTAEWSARPRGMITVMPQMQVWNDEYTAD